MQKSKTLFLLFTLLLSGCSRSRELVERVNNSLLSNQIESEAIGNLLERLKGGTLTEESSSDKGVLYSNLSKGIEYQSTSSKETYDLFLNGYQVETETDAIDGYHGFSESRDADHNIQTVYFEQQDPYSYEIYSRKVDLEGERNGYEYGLSTSQHDPSESFESYVLGQFSWLLSQATDNCYLYQDGDSYVFASEVVTPEETLSNPLLDTTGDSVQVYQRVSIETSVAESDYGYVFTEIEYIQENFVKSDFYGNQLKDEIIDSLHRTLSLDYGNREYCQGGFSFYCDYRAAHIPELDIDNGYSAGGETLTFSDRSYEYTKALKADKPNILFFMLEHTFTSDQKLFLYTVDTRQTSRARTFIEPEDIHTGPGLRVAIGDSYGVGSLRYFSIRDEEDDSASVDVQLSVVVDMYSGSASIQADRIWG